MSQTAVPTPQTAPPAGAPLTAAPLTAGPPAAGPLTAGPPTAGPLSAAPLTAGPPAAAPLTAGPPAAGPLTAGPPTAGPLTAGPPTAAPLTAGPPTAAPLTAGPPTAGPLTAGPPAAAPLTAGPPSAGRPTGAGWSVATRPRRMLPDLLAGSGYLLTGLPLAVISFSLLLTGTALALGTFAIVVGFAVMALTLGIAQGFAALERARVGLVLGRPLPAARYRPLRDGTVGSVLTAGADPRRWLDLVHGLVSFPVALVTFVLTTVWWSVGIGGTGYVFWEWALPGEAGDEQRRGLADLLGWAGRAADIGLTTTIGVIALLTLPLVVRGCVAVQTGVARALLGGPDPA